MRSSYVHPSSLLKSSQLIHFQPSMIGLESSIPALRIDFDHSIDDPFVSLDSMRWDLIREGFYEEFLQAGEAEGGSYPRFL